MAEKRVTFRERCKVFLLPDNNRPRRHRGRFVIEIRKEKEEKERRFRESEESPILMVLCWSRGCSRRGTENQYRAASSEETHLIPR